MENVVFKGWTCTINMSLRYGNGRQAIVLNDHVTGEQIAVATVNVDDIECGEGETFIKDYSENEGIFDVLHKAGIIAPIQRVKISEWVEAIQVKVLV